MKLIKGEFKEKLELLYAPSIMPSMMLFIGGMSMEFVRWDKNFSISLDFWMICFIFTEMTYETIKLAMAHILQE